MKSKAIVKIDFSSEKMLKVALDALRLEAEKLFSQRARVFVACEGSQLILTVEAKDTVALRAALNSFLRWLSLINDVCSIVSSMV